MRWPIDKGWKGCELTESWTHVVTFNFPLTHDLDLGFSRSNFKKSYLMNGMADWHGTKGMWVDRMLDPCCDFQCSPLTWPWPWIFKVKFWKSRISGMGWPIDMGWKGCELIECRTHVVTFNFPLTHDLGLAFSRSNFEKVLSYEWDADWHGPKGMWVYRMLDPCCDFQCSPLPWPWSCIFEVKFWKSHILGMGWPIDMGWKGCESIECWTHLVTFNFPFTHDLDLGFSRSNFEKVISKE